MQFFEIGTLKNDAFFPIQFAGFKRGHDLNVLIVIDFKVRGRHLSLRILEIERFGEAEKLSVISARLIQIGDFKRDSSYTDNRQFYNRRSSLRCATATTAAPALSTAARILSRPRKNKRSNTEYHRES